jgi:hypothetical protein
VSPARSTRSDHTGPGGVTACRHRGRRGSVGRTACPRGHAGTLTPPPTTLRGGPPCRW